MTTTRVQRPFSSCAAVASAAAPFETQGVGTIGVLLCHGFTGSVASLRPWAEGLVDAGFEVSAPRLPGHGTDWRELNRTDWSDWYACVERARDDLAHRVDQVIVGGLSMGGALALRLAEREPLAGLILVNPSVASRDTSMLALPALKHLKSSVNAIGNDIAKPGQDEGSYPRTPLAAAHSMTKLWADVRAHLDQVRVPVLLMTSRTDHVVDALSAELLEKALPDVRRVWLERSYHVATLDYDADLILAESIDFIRRCTG